MSSEFLVRSMSSCAPIVMLLTLSGCVNSVPDYLVAAKAEDVKMCRWEARRDTSMRGTQAMQVTDRFDLYVQCMKNRPATSESVADRLQSRADASILGVLQK